MEKNIAERNTAKLFPKDELVKAFHLPQCCFAATCGDCYHNSGGWCKKHGGWVDADKWACSDYA